LNLGLIFIVGTRFFCPPEEEIDAAVGIGVAVTLEGREIPIQEFKGNYADLE
jgi:hypothetical protein